MTSSSGNFLFVNGVASSNFEIPTVTTFLENHSGAYTTTRTHKRGMYVLFWRRHLHRLAQSAMILSNSRPELFLNPGMSVVLKSAPSSLWESTIWSVVNDTMTKAMPVALNSRKNNDELAITALISGNSGKLEEHQNVDEEILREALGIYVHISPYSPLTFGVEENTGHLAAVGCGRDVPLAKYSKWARIRKALENLRPPSATELLLCSNGDKILEGCLTNFFVVCRCHSNDTERGLPSDCKPCSFEVQTAPLADGILPGIIRQKIIEACGFLGIPVREVAPSWLKRESWEEAFITSSLRLVQHVESIRVPQSWESLASRTWQEVVWEVKKFKKGAGEITRRIQKVVEVDAEVEGFRVGDLLRM